MSPNGSISRFTSPFREPGSSSSVCIAIGRRRALALRVGGSYQAGLVGQPMADEGSGRAAEPGERLGLEWQQAQDMIDIAASWPVRAAGRQAHTLGQT